MKNSNKLIPMLLLQELVQTNKVNKSSELLAFVVKCDEVCGVCGVCGVMC